ncbi:hypothetical protein Hdeb2414_s0001g00030081 [Helianthus debilis subsp. tardiflorus]
MRGTPWMPEDDQAQRRTEHDNDTRFRTLLRCNFKQRIRSRYVE